jgi:hypothetical protein
MSAGVAPLIMVARCCDRRATLTCRACESRRKCRFGVKRDLSPSVLSTPPLPLHPVSDRERAAAQYVAKGHVWTAPGWQGESSLAALVGAAMCSACLRGTQMTAGHNALRGSGPDQQHAFEDALAHVGCPDRRIDRRCIKCCSSFPTVTSHRCVRL